MKIFKYWLENRLLTENTCDNLKEIQKELQTLLGVILQDATVGDNEALGAIRNVCLTGGIPERAIKELIRAVNFVLDMIDKQTTEDDRGHYTDWMRAWVIVSCGNRESRYIKASFGNGAGYINGISWYCVWNGSKSRSSGSQENAQFGISGANFNSVNDEPFISH